jgi:hypothetical protein
MTQSKIIAAFGRPHSRCCPAWALRDTRAEGAARANADDPRRIREDKHDYDHINNPWGRQGRRRALSEPPAGPEEPRGRESRRETTFLSKNRWDNVNSQWVPDRRAAAQLSTMSREEVRKETDSVPAHVHLRRDRQEAWVPKR